MRRTAFPGVVAAALAALAALPAAAVNDMFAKDAPIARMTEEDLALAAGALRKALEEGQAGQAYQWNNPKTSASGSVTPGEAFKKQGMRCRSATFALTARGQSSRSRWNLCRTPQGWKVAEGG